MTNVTSSKKELSFHCPITRNQKFEMFIDDLFDLNFDRDRTKKEIIDYVRTLDAWYSEKTRELYSKKVLKARRATHSVSDSLSKRN
jgi:hypothetical protein